MRIIFMLLLTAIYINNGFSQHTFQAIIQDSKTLETLIGATAVLESSTIGASSDENGKIELKNISNGLHTIVISFIGYKNHKENLVFPLLSNEPLVVLLESSGEELDEILISTTQSSRTIDNIPTRMESISGDELEEKGNMKPGDIRTMLNESTGIQTQQTSTSSFNSTIRIQGLDGKYTQILRDGFPLYSGFSDGLSLLQIVPLDLKRVEIIKGASSTLYGGGAISGLVNLISKIPSKEKELNFIFNGTSALGLDASGFYAQKFKNFGTTIFASYNLGSPYDPSGIGLSAIPKFNRYTLNPKLFFYFDEQTSMNIGINIMEEDRIGGDMKYIENKGDSIHSYFEKNKTNRLSTQFEFSKILNENSKFLLKNSLNYFDRSIEIPNYKFSGTQISSFSEITFNHKRDKTEWIFGLNLWTDAFKQNVIDTTKVVDYQHQTIGGFVQNTWELSNLLSIETGLRVDYQNQYGLFILPRVSCLFKINKKLSSRIGGGFGYKSPTVFTEDAERIQFKNILPINTGKSKAEESFGGSIDFNYKTPLSDQILFSINTLFFYTRVNNPFVLVPIQKENYEFQQPKGFIDTKGIETNVKLTFNDFKLFIGYTLADVNNHYNGITSSFPLVALHRLNNVLMYEKESNIKIGLEAYYYSPQKLNDGLTGQSYWLAGLMIEKFWGKFSVFVNFENYFDTRQTKFDTIYTGTITNPNFRDIYAPVDGFVMNGGIKIKL